MGHVMDKHFDNKQAEVRLRELWESNQIYATGRGANTYTVDTPPPTVSGKLHIGHIFSYTHTDIIVRYQRLTGATVFYPFGFDDNGLPTERFVELKRGISPHQVGRQEFAQICAEEAALAEQDFETLWRRIGLSVDWAMKYSTITPLTQRISQTSFLRLLKKGSVYRHLEPAIYCTAYRTTVSQADLEDVEKETLFSEILFKTESENLAIATTRPELLSSCVALFYHPSDTRYKHLAGKQAVVPLFGNQVPILADEKVQVDKGTGLVMCCTFGDKTDIDWFKRHNLPYRPSIGLDGRWLPETGPFAGLKVAEARARALELLTERNLMVKQQKITHTVSIYERSKKEVEYLMLPQWFVKILPHKTELLALADTIDWYPAFMKTRFIDWVQNLQWDWCISRQRYSGVPFPVWYDKKTGEMYLPEEKYLPIDPRETVYPGTVPAGVELVPDTDVMDTWNTSSLSPYICEALYKGSDQGIFDMPEKLTFLPMAMRPQAHDIIRTWAFYTMVKTWLHHGVAPWKSIVISGHVLSPEGSKISKSKGNNPLEPERLLETYPADVIRYWTASGSLGYDVAFSENTLKIGNKLMTKLWNASRFAREHLQGDSWKAEPVAITGALNEWILSRIATMFARYQECFARNEFGLALEAVEQFFWNDYCDNYLEFVKFHFFNPEKFDAHEVDATRWTVGQVTLRLLQLFAPFMPYVTEELYQAMFREFVGAPSIHVTRFDAIQKSFGATDINNMQFFLELVNQIRRLKSEHGLSLKTELADCIIVGPQPVLDFLKTVEETIKGMTGAKVIGYATTSTGASYLQENNGVWRGTIVLG